MIFTNTRLIFPDGIRDGLEVVVHEKKIAAIRERISARSEPQILDLDRNYLAPGFIDLHVHGALGRDTMEASPEAFRVICDFHASGGTTSLLLTTATAPLGEINQFFKFAPGFQTIRDPVFYHSDADTPDTVPASGLEAITQSTVRFIQACLPLGIAGIYAHQTAVIEEEVEGDDGEPVVKRKTTGGDPDCFKFFLERAWQLARLRDLDHRLRGLGRRAAHIVAARDQLDRRSDAIDEEDRGVRAPAIVILHRIAHVLDVPVLQILALAGKLGEPIDERHQR